MANPLVKDLVEKPDLTKPRWDQNTFVGRAMYFFAITNPIHFFASNKKIEESRNVLLRYEKGDYPPNLTIKDLWKAKHLYDSAYHPESGNKMMLFGRMSGQVPCNTIITSGLLSFYKSTPSVIFWQWINQTYNAGVNYTNKSGKESVTNKHLLQAYVCATGGALISALTLNSFSKKLPSLYGRFVPFCAIALANAINIPLMRQQEFTEGISLFNENNVEVGKSTKVASTAITQVVLSRIGMAVPYMVLTPILTNHLNKKSWFNSRPWLVPFFQAIVCGSILLLSNPLCCAIFPQRSSVQVENLEPQLKNKLQSLPNAPKILYYNKGL